MSEGKVVGFKVEVYRTEPWLAQGTVILRNREDVIRCCKKLKFIGW